LIFQTLFRNRPELRKIAAERIVPIQGDLVVDGCGINPDVRALLVEDLDIIINSAASVSFNEVMRDALQINYFGSLRVLALAKECKKLEVLCHVSTAYVNANMPSKTYCPEKMFDRYDG